ncbi:unnamed protein product [Meloidogyne enterolobii]|uniref:Uncharacterized protein n=3 Tax=Meloidogyne enterolobii TaxID=390850 RepID=A0ACB1A0C3_MELEN|nr:unnamed protein product [Meloidogyne enterolobii]
MQQLYQDVLKAILILDQDGKRILGKYYDKQILATEKEQSAFEKNLFQKTHKANAEIILFDGFICVYRSNVDLFFYVIGSCNENELILQSVLNCFYEDFYKNASSLDESKSVQQQKQRKQTKNKIERRISKGRRIRYVEIEKLVNFFPAVPERIPWSHERRDELFKSLFV